MCDTMVAFFKKPTERSFFAKNSDREPGELQIIQFSMNPRAEFKSQPYIEARKKYINGSLEHLSNIFDQYDHPYPAIISRPTWMWGAEMGVNSFGLAIGNEAVFSKEKVVNDGLLGMDILRLALHNCRTAKEGLDFIIDLIQTYGQGGDGGYTKPLKYHNSYLIKDLNEAYLLETSAKHWVAKKIISGQTISNCYSIQNDYDLIDSESENLKNFKAKYENKLFSFFSKGNQRRKLSASYLMDNSLDIMSWKNLLRLHGNSLAKPRRGMRSICMHSGWLIKSETTSSLIIDYIGEKSLVWVTASPHPCIALFKPLVLPIKGNEEVITPISLEHVDNLIDWTKAVSYSDKLRGLAKRIVEDHQLFQEKIKPLRDELETEFLRLIYDDIETKTEADLLVNCEECFNLEKAYIKKLEKILRRK